MFGIIIYTYQKQELSDRISYELKVRKDSG